MSENSEKLESPYVAGGVVSPQRDTLHAEAHGMFSEKGDRRRSIVVDRKVFLQDLKIGSLRLCR